MRLDSKIIGSKTVEEGYKIVNQEKSIDRIPLTKEPCLRSQIAEFTAPQQVEEELSKLESTLHPNNELVDNESVESAIIRYLAYGCRNQAIKLIEAIDEVPTDEPKIPSQSLTFANAMGDTEIVNLLSGKGAVVDKLIPVLATRIENMGINIDAANAAFSMGKDISPAS